MDVPVDVKHSVQLVPLDCDSDSSSVEVDSGATRTRKRKREDIQPATSVLATSVKVEVKEEPTNDEVDGQSYEDSGQRIVNPRNSSDISDQDLLSTVNGSDSSSESSESLGRKRTRNGPTVTEFMIPEDEEATSLVGLPENQSTNQAVMEISISDDEEESNATGIVEDHGDGQGTDGTNVDLESRYEFRQRRQINYEEIENPTGDKEPREKKKITRDVLDVFAVDIANPKKLAKLAGNPAKMEDLVKCMINFMDANSTERFPRIRKFFEQCGPQFEKMMLFTRFDPENFIFFKSILKTTTCLTRIDYRYQHNEDAYMFLEMMESLVPTLKSLKLTSATGSECLHDNHVKLLSTMTPLTSLELGDALWEDVSTTVLEGLLEKHKDSLESFTIHGGYRGVNNEEIRLVRFPVMPKLHTLSICPKYSFHSEIKSPHSKKQRVVSVDVYEKEEPIKFSIELPNETPKLKHLVLGNLVNIEDLRFSQIRQLREFRCGSYWNLSITFPTREKESNVTEFQFPDCLKDPLFVVTARKHFQNVKKVWLNLPSVPVLRAFFKAFENSGLTHLFLTTQFDFEKTMESCLLPNMEDVLAKSTETQEILRTLRQYKHFDEYIKYNNVELPVEADDLMENHSAGIAALKSLKVLRLEHIPRNLLIPIADEERKWYDHNCKFMSTTFGYANYPLNDKCHKEILKLDLDEYTWHNIKINSTQRKDFEKKGLREMTEQESAQCVGYVYDDEDEDIFEKVRKSRPGTSVKIMPSMLFQAFKPKLE